MMVLAQVRVFGISSVGASGAAAVVRTELFYVRSAAVNTGALRLRSTGMYHRVVL
jgi:hypothetical protein